MQRSALQSKRELFFKNELPPSSGVSGGTAAPPATAPSPAITPSSTPTPLALKEALAKRAAERSETNHAVVNNSEDNKERYSSKAERDKVPERRTKELDGYVGFANLPNQVYRKAVKRGFDFTLMVVGESGLGKSTLINSMFLADIYSNEYPGPSHRIKKTVQVETSKVLLRENGVNLTLTIVDTPGFGDAVDNSNCWQPVIDYIESKYEEYLNAESRVNRKTLVDSRVHCCLYFIAPSGHGLKPLDVEFMQRLHDKVNIIPAIAKADTMTPDECSHWLCLQTIGTPYSFVYRSGVPASHRTASLASDPGALQVAAAKGRMTLSRRHFFNPLGADVVVWVRGVHDWSNGVHS